jgi:hypothetical protein
LVAYLTVLDLMTPKGEEWEMKEENSLYRILYPLRNSDIRL